MFASYLLENRTTRRRIAIRGWSYVWAGLFGPFYVLSKGGRRSVFGAIALSLALTLVLVGVVGATSYIPALQQVIVVPLALGAVLVVQSVKIVDILRNSYRHRGWKVRMAD
jgi:hypothetical protein